MEVVTCDAVLRILASASLKVGPNLLSGSAKSSGVATEGQCPRSARPELAISKHLLIASVIYIAVPRFVPKCKYHESRAFFPLVDIVKSPGTAFHIK